MLYGGDIDYLASWSPLSALTTTSTLAICPAAVTLYPGQKADLGPVPAPLTDAELDLLRKAGLQGV